jgi:hypothetical protein
MSLYKASKLASNALIIGLLLAVLWILFRGASRSGYEGSPLVSAPGAAAASGPKSLFDIKPSLECTPGPAEHASWYSRGLTPGGLCGDADFVRDQIRDYSIADGIGGSLLEK